MEDWVTIRNLKKRRPDLGTRKIAKLLGISRNTVKQALACSSVPEYKRKVKVNPDIEPFKEYVFEQVVVKGLRGSRVLNEIYSKGYKGSQSAFYRYIKTIKQSKKRVFQPYETAPGEQAQFDWSPYTVRLNGELTKVYVFTYLLGFSRFRIYEASLSDTQGLVLEALESSFHQTGGIVQRIQTDNAKCFITNSSKDNFQWNKRYLQFCGHFGFKPSRSLPGHPWSKGKVENPFGYLEDHFIKGNSFTSFPDFIKQLKQFQDQVNERVHCTTKQPPKLLFEREKESLTILPKEDYVNVKEEVRKVTADCLISFLGNRYSVPWQFALKEVWVRISKGYYLEVYSSHNAIIAAHLLSTTKGRVIIDPSHYKAHKVERGNWKRLCELFLTHFPLHPWFLTRLKAQKRINPAYHLTQILDIMRYYSIEDMKTAFETCRRYNVFTSVFVKGYLENHARIKAVKAKKNHSSGEKEIATDNKDKEEQTPYKLYFRYPMSVKRPLTEYQMTIDFPSNKEEVN